MTNPEIQFRTPKLIVKNISNKDISVLERVQLKPGKRIDVFAAFRPGVISEDLVISNLFAPSGDLYVEVVKKKTLEILEIDLPSFHYSRVTPANIVSLLSGLENSFPVIDANNNFKWVSVEHPIQIVGHKLSVPPASEEQDGYLTKEDYVAFKLSSGGSGEPSASVSPGMVIWQYQDFTAPLGTSLQLTQFQNGTGLIFEQSWVISESSTIVLTSDNYSPPTTVTTFPGKYLSSNRVFVSSHIGTTVILNQTPHSTQSCRVYYQVNLPAGEPYPLDYVEDPNFTNESEMQRLDDAFVNIVGDEHIFGEKLFQNLKAESFAMTAEPYDGYVLTSDAYGNAVWQPPSISAEGGYIIVSASPPLLPNPGDAWFNTQTQDIYFFDAVRDKWLSPKIFEMGASRNSNVVSNLYLRTYDGVPTSVAPLILPYDCTLVAVTISTSDSCTWLAQIEKNNVAVESVNLSDVSSLFDANKNIDFEAGDKVSIFASGSGILFPRVTLLFARRAG